MKKTLIFDLDGTLLDTIEDMAICMNEVLRSYSQPSFPIDKYRTFVGWGVDVLVANVVATLGVDLDKKELARSFKKLYESGLNKHTKPYDGICELLEVLGQKGYGLGVLSNKPHELTKVYIEHFFGDYNFTQVFGQQEGVPTKPDPQVALQIADSFRMSLNDCYFVGDTKVDMQTAKNASMNAIGVSWGFRGVEELQEHGADFIVHHPKEIVDIVKGG